MIKIQAQSKTKKNWETMNDSTKFSIKNQPKQS